MEKKFQPSREEFYIHSHLTLKCFLLRGAAILARSGGLIIITSREKREQLRDHPGILQSAILACGTRLLKNG